MSSTRTERIVYVEDDDDIRMMMETFLVGEGYGVTSCRTAEDALDELERERCDLLLTDYFLPAENADWLIKNATSRGLLSGVPVIVLSAEYRPEGVENFPLFRKPVPMDVLLAGIEEALQSRAAPPASRPSPSEPKMELVLYVSTPSHESDAAKRNLGRIIRTIGADHVHVIVHDIGGGDEASLRAIEDERVVVVPTLVRRFPAPKVWIAGDLSKREYVVGILTAARLQA